MDWDSPWRHIEMGECDPILELNEAYKRDTDPKKINLSIGAYRNDESSPVVLDCVKKAEKELLPKKYPFKEYAPMGGVDEFCELSKKLIYGENVCTQNVAIVQSISGTGALNLGASFLSKFLPGETRKVLISDPSWSNHKSIFTNFEFQTEQYPYYDRRTHTLDEQGMLKALQDAPSGSIVVLHACGHNPTGLDPSPLQWRLIHEVIKQKAHISFFDLAYQGFATGDLEKDIFAIRHFITDPPGPILVAQSYAKNMGMYGERVGTLSVWCSGKPQKEAVVSQLKLIIRKIYSSPPIHGARLVSLVLGNEELKRSWQAELKEMTARIIAMRTSLREELEKLAPSRTWKHITDQIGMFCYTGLTPEQCHRLLTEFHIYMTSDGRMSMAGVTTSNVKTIAAVFSKVLQ